MTSSSLRTSAILYHSSRYDVMLVLRQNIPILRQGPILKKAIDQKDFKRLHFFFIGAPVDKIIPCNSMLNVSKPFSSRIDLYKIFITMGKFQTITSYCSKAVR